MLIIHNQQQIYRYFSICHAFLFFSPALLLKFNKKSPIIATLHEHTYDDKKNFSDISSACFILYTFLEVLDMHGRIKYKFVILFELVCGLFTGTKLYSKLFFVSSFRYLLRLNSSCFTLLLFFFG